eukprot:140004_1
MLKNLFLVGSDGILLFEKEFISGLSQTRLVANLLTALLEHCRAKIGMPATYMEFSTVSVAIMTESEYDVSCMLLYDREDGDVFGRLLANQLLTVFVEMFASVLSRKNPNADFRVFDARISETIRRSVDPVLENLQSQRGIELALLITGVQVSPPSLQIEKVHKPIDKLGIQANINALLSNASEILTHSQDAALSITLNSGSSKVIISSVEHSKLVVKCDKNIDEAISRQRIDDASRLLRRILLLTASLQDIWINR